MKRNTKKNREKLAAETVNQIELGTMIEMLRDQLEDYYEGLFNKEFNDEWDQVFGED